MADTEQQYTVVEEGGFLGGIPEPHVEVERAVYDAAETIIEALPGGHQTDWTDHKTANDRADACKKTSDEEGFKFWCKVARYINERYHCGGEVRVFEKGDEHYMTDPNGTVLVKMISL